VRKAKQVEDVGRRIVGCVKVRDDRYTAEHVG
jgi:hypothetical protein